MHDFQLISIFQFRLGPAVAGHDFTVEFDGDSVRLHAEFVDERAQRMRGSGTALAIDRQVHRMICKLGSLAGLVELRPAHLEFAGGGASFKTRLHQHGRIG